LGKTLPLPTRIPILYLILGVLTLVSVVPMYFYASWVVSTSRENLKGNERLLQNTITSSLAEDIAQRHTNLQTVLGNLATAIKVTTGGDLSGAKVESPELRALLETLVSSSRDLAYATLINADGKVVAVGSIAPDAFLQNELFFRAFGAARDGRQYTGQALGVGAGKNAKTVMVVSTPIRTGGRFVGMIGAVVDLQYAIDRLEDVSQRAGMLAYAVDSHGRLVICPRSKVGGPKYVTGEDMNKIEIVKSFVEGGKTLMPITTEFKIAEGGRQTAMLGTYRRVPSLDWAIIAQKEQREAYAGVFEMQFRAELLALLAVLAAVIIGVFAARGITSPLQVLTASSRAIARGDFSQRVKLKSRTEIGELAQTFNRMSEDLEQFVLDLKRAAEENRALFLGSIQMLAGAVDEKDPYTRGHSDRVTRYSVLLAKELGLSEEEIEIVRIAAQLHDVGKIGIEDRILKKPGALTPEEFEIMKTHTVKGANILRPVQQLKAMIPGIELHHESLDGRGYPYALQGTQIPMSARIIMVADTFDAMTTNRPYQSAMDPEYVVRIINSLTKTKFDPRVVGALTAAFQRGEFYPRTTAAPLRDATESIRAAAPAAAAAVETSRV
jgi:putative nucleotidyltransferase with HDIG domain